MYIAVNTQHHDRRGWRTNKLSSNFSRNPYEPRFDHCTNRIYDMRLYRLYNIFMLYYKIRFSDEIIRFSSRVQSLDESPDE